MFYSIILLFSIFYLLQVVNGLNITWENYLITYPNVNFHLKSKLYFEDNLKYIREVNLKNLSYKLGLTPFLHLSEQEWKSGFNKFNFNISRNNNYYVRNLKYFPDSWSWKEQNLTTKVKDQGQVGSCYEHAAVETIETAFAIKSNKLINLSVQQGVDCSELNSGINGGLPNFSYKYSMNYEKCSEDEYPYSSGITGKVGICHECKGIIPKLSNYIKLKSNDEIGMIYAVLINSLAVGINADSREFQMYKSGVLDFNCENDQNSVDHAVVIEGYGSENNKNYWLVRNSWSEDWGDKGYVKMVRNKNICGISNMVSYPYF